MDIVSVVVVTYKSINVLETFESIKKQDYKDIELIITDDCSNDCTINIIYNWIKNNKKRFVNVKFLKGYKNRGVSHNANRGLSCATGKYIKIIAGDDILIEHAITSYVEYYRSHEFDIIFSNIQYFGDEKLIKKDMENSKAELSRNILKTLLQEKIRNYYLEKEYMPSQTIFFSHDFYKKMGGYNEKYPFWEDGPLYCNCILNNWTIGFVDDVLVKGRISSKSISHSVNEKKLSYIGYMHLKDNIHYFFCLYLKACIRYKKFDLIKNKIPGVYKDIIRVLNNMKYYRRI